MHQAHIRSRGTETGCGFRGSRETGAGHYEGTEPNRNDGFVHGVLYEISLNLRAL